MIAGGVDWDIVGEATINKYLENTKKGQDDYCEGGALEADCVTVSGTLGQWS